MTDYTQGLRNDVNDPWQLWYTTFEPRVGQAAVLRANYDEYVKTFRPLENQLLDMTTYAGGRGVASGMMPQLEQQRQQAQQTAQGQQQRDMAAYGMAPTAAESQVISRQNSLADTTGQTELKNRMNIWQTDLNRQLVGSNAGGKL